MLPAKYGTLIMVIVIMGHNTPIVLEHITEAGPPRPECYLVVGLKLAQRPVEARPGRQDQDCQQRLHTITTTTTSNQSSSGLQMIFQVFVRLDSD